MPLTATPATQRSSTSQACHNCAVRAAVYNEFGGPVSVTEVPNPSPGPGEVVVEVRATGVCRSDWHGWMGHDKDIQKLPHVPGHEFSGVVHMVGEGVEGWERGDRVTAPFVAACGICDTCLAGNAQVCPNQVQNGFTHWGSFAELMTIRHAEHNLVRLPDDFGFVESAVLGCRFSTAYRALVEQGQTRSGDWVAVHGCGGVGLSAVMIGSAMGANIIGIDTNQSALELASSLGASHTLEPGPNLVEVIREVSDGGVHVGIDAIGDSGVVSTSVASLRSQGRHVQVGLLPDQQVPLRLDRIIGGELQVVGSHGLAASSFPAMFDLITSSGMDIRPLVRRDLSLEEGARVLETFEHRTEPGTAVITQF